MRITNLLFIVLLLIFLGACSRGAIKVDPNSSDTFLLNQIQSATLMEFFRGNEKKSELIETSLDKSEPDRLSRANYLLNKAERIDSSLYIFSNIIFEAKKRMVVNKSELKRIWLTKHSYNPISHFRLQTEGLYVRIPENIESIKKELTAQMLKIRKTIAHEIVEYTNADSTTHNYFKDPEIQLFSDPQKLLKELDVAIKASNVMLDEQESLKKIYLQLTQLIYTQPDRLKNPVQILSYFTSLEHGILACRADALSLINIRISSCNYSFDKITPIIGAPDVCLAGDTIEIYALMAAYDSYKIPSAIINGEPFSEMKSGIVKHKIVIPNQNKLELKGSLTVKNKSGVPKTMPFEKTIRIIQKEN